MISSQHVSSPRRCCVRAAVPRKKPASTMIFMLVLTAASVQSSNRPAEKREAAGPLAAGPYARAKYTVVNDWNAYEIGPDRHPPTPAGPVANITTLEGCEQHCTATAGCVQFAWNKGGASKKTWCGFGQTRRHIFMTKCTAAAAAHALARMVPLCSWCVSLDSNLRALNRCAATRGATARSVPRRRGAASRATTSCRAASRQR